MKTTSLPQCLGFIMDGNRRWAAAAQLSSIEGHQKGREVLHTCVEWVRDRGIPHAVFYAFSTENWQRSASEVSALMDLFRTELRTLADKQVRVKIIGNRTDFADDLRSELNKLEERTSHHTGTTVWIALSYGGRAEIVAAVNEAVKAGVLVTEDTFATRLMTSEMPDPDMIIRTSGEQRLSNFLPWQSTYSELLFLDKPWPALTIADFDAILSQYDKRTRRRGK